MKTGLHNLKLIVSLIALIIFDQLTKFWAVTQLKSGKVISIIPNVFELNYLDGGNTGAAWGIFSGKIAMFIIFTIIVVIKLILCIYRISKLLTLNCSLNTMHLISMQYIITLLIAGAIVNGYVVDFLYFKLIDFPVFNVADCYVTIACALLIIFCVFVIKDKEFNAIFSLKKDDSEDKKDK